jgi:MFS family permease
MDTLDFSVTAVALAAAIGSGAGLVINPLVGRLSDRINRQLMLALTYSGAGLALVLTASAASLPAFILATILVTLGHAGDAVAQALVTDMVAPAEPDRHLSLLSTAKWISGIAGFGGAGYAVQLFGMSNAMLATALLPLLAVVLLAEIRTTPATDGIEEPGRQSRLALSLWRMRNWRRRALGV